jgi:hypothetical protein
MLEKLLRRIVGRRANTSLLQSGTDSRLLTSTHASSLSDSEVRAFPARSYTTQAPLKRLAPCTWDGACKAHFEACVNPMHPPTLPALFSTFGGGHATVAQALWIQHKNPYPMLVHISGPKGVVAVYDQDQQRVWVRLDMLYTEPHALAWVEMPASTMPPAGAEFGSTTVHHLLWYYGQTVPLAPKALPPDMGSAPLQLRRFPPVEPQALEMRHLALLRVLSAGALTFAQLQDRTSPLDQGHLCGDLASLYFTGSLVLLAQPQ